MAEDTGTEHVAQPVGEGSNDQNQEHKSPGNSVRRTMLSNAKFEVEKFDGTNNFGMWQCEVSDLLFREGSDIALESKPKDYSDDDWNYVNRQACGTIRLCLRKDQKYFVMKENIAAILWKKLEDKFMTKSVENRLYLKKKLFRFQFKKGTPMIEHLNNFNKILADLQNLDVEFIDEDKALLLLNSLPESYEHLTTTLLYGKDEVKFVDVSNALVNNEYRKKDQHENKDSTSEALVATRGRQSNKSGGLNNRGRSRSKSRGEDSSRRCLAKDECAYCHQKGHWKKDCPNKNKPAANVAQNPEEEDAAFTVSLSDTYSDKWILDSGCSYHMCPNRDWFSSFEEIDGGVVLMGNNNACQIKGIGTIRLKMHDGTIRRLTNVRYIPDLKKNLISLGVLDTDGYKVKIENGVLKVIRGALVAMKGTQKSNLYFLDGSTVTGRVSISSSPDNQTSDSSRLWHMRLGHVGEKALQGLVKQGLLKGAKTGKIDFCEHCVLGKQTRVKFGAAIHRTKGTLDYIHTDVWGPSRNVSLGGKRYFVTFIDDFSRYVWVYPMSQKDEVLDIFLKWKILIETQTGRKIKRLRSDNGGEYKSDPFLKVCQDEGIVRHFTVPGMPQQNGVAERMNRTLIEKVRCMLSHSGLGKSFWAEALSYATHIVNRLPASALYEKTPKEVWSGELVSDYDSLRIFGCPAYYHVKESKLDPRAKKSVFLGFSGGVKGFRLWSDESKKIMLSRDVTFDESVMLITPSEIENVSPNIISKVVLEAPVDSQNIAPVVDHGKDKIDDQDDISEEAEIHLPSPPIQPENIATSRPRREIRKPARYSDLVAFALPIIDDDVPCTYREAVQSADSVKWKMAMDEEMKSLHQNKTWDLVKIPKGKKTIGCKWVYAKKEGLPGEDNIRYKARLVAKGYAQKEGIDYNEVFSPVVKHSSIRILLALVAQYDLELAQMDVKTAFLHGTLNEEIYMTQPDGSNVPGCEKWACKLSKSLYGLKQSPRQWYKRFDSFIREHKYTRSQFDHCVYFRKLQDGTFIYLLLYVDDMLIAFKSKVEVAKLKTLLNSEFEMKDLGEAKKILGMEITRDRAASTVSLSQTQ